MGRRMEKSKTRGLRWRQFTKTTKEIIIIVNNFQKNHDAIQFFSLPDDWVAASPRAAIAELADFPTLLKTFELMENFQLLGKKRFLPTWPMPIYKLNMMSMVWNISIGQLGLAAWLCSLPALVHLLVSWRWATGGSPWFLSNNWKHRCYQHSSHIKSKTPGGKLTLSQPKPGHVRMAILKGA